MKHTNSNEITELKDFFISFLGLKTPLLNIFSGITAYLLAKTQTIIIANDIIFFSITMVVLLDFIFGVLANRNNFKTKKALKVVWYLVGYWSIAAMTITIEMAFKSAFWLTDTVILTILTFQVISILKNASKCGLINNSQLKAILDKIDKHKDEQPIANETNQTTDNI